MFFVYILYSASFNRIYVGQTKNIENRLESHNSGNVISTKHYKPWTMIHSEQFATRSEAMNREKELKTSVGRRWIRTHSLNGGVRQLTD